MKTSKWLVITLAVAISLGGVAMMKAKAGNAGLSRLGGGQFLSRAKARLGLTDDQVAQIKAQLAGEKDKLSTLLTASHEARVNLRKTIQTSGATEQQIRAASAKLAAVAADIAVERASLYAKISPILTPEQMQKIADFQERMDDFVDGAILNFGKRLAE